MKQILASIGLEPHSLKLEITESLIIENPEAARPLLLQLKALDIQLGIDDFGTGYSSLSYLHRFPIDRLKIDRSFVNRMGLDKENAESVRTIVTLAHNLAKCAAQSKLSPNTHLSTKSTPPQIMGQGGFGHSAD